MHTLPPHPLLHSSARELAASTAGRPAQREHLRGMSSGRRRDG